MHAVVVMVVMVVLVGGGGGGVDYCFSNTALKSLLHPPPTPHPHKMPQWLWSSEVFALRLHFLCQTEHSTKAILNLTNCVLCCRLSVMSSEGGGTYLSRHIHSNAHYMECKWLSPQGWLCWLRPCLSALVLWEFCSVINATDAARWIRLIQMLMIIWSTACRGNENTDPVLSRMPSISDFPEWPPMWLVPVRICGYVYVYVLPT